MAADAIVIKGAREKASRDLLGYLLVSYGGLTRDDLTSISDDDALNDFSVDAAIHSVQRYVVGDTKMLGLSLCHPRFRDYLAENKIKKVAAAGGPAATICDLPPGARWGASWGHEGTVFFAARTGIFKVPSSGGTPTRLTTVDTVKGDRHLLPQLLPGGKTLLFTAPPNIVTMSLATGEQRTVLDARNRMAKDSPFLRARRRRIAVRHRTAALRMSSRTARTALMMFW